MDQLEIVSPDDIEYKSSLADPRVWIGHFHDVNYTVTANDQDEASFDGIDFKSITKYRCETGNSSLVNPPRPAATKVLVQQSLLSGLSSISSNLASHRRIL